VTVKSTETADNREYTSGEISKARKFYKMEYFPLFQPEKSRQRTVKQESVFLWGDKDT